MTVCPKNDEPGLWPLAASTRCWLFDGWQFAADKFGGDKFGGELFGCELFAAELFDGERPGDEPEQ